MDGKNELYPKTEDVTVSNCTPLVPPSLDGRLGLRALTTLEPECLPVPGEFMIHVAKGV